MMILRYEELMKKPERLLAFTGLKQEDIEQMLPSFQAAWEEHRKNYHRPSEGRKRTLGAGRPGRLHRVADKLLFMLVYFKVYPLQEVQGALFGMGHSFADPNPTEKALSSLYLDQKRRLFMVGQQPLKLAQREFRLLDYLYQHQGLVCSYDSCIQAIWGDDHLGDDNRRLGQAVYTLRKLLREAGLQADDLIKTVKGEGYQLTL